MAVVQAENRFHTFARMQWDGDVDMAIVDVDKMTQLVSGKANEIGQGML